jgi:TRAP-type transport system small permease protein
MITKALGWISRALLVVASLLAMSLAFIVVVDVIGRAGFNRPLRGTAEIVASSIVVICYLQVTYAIVSGGMMKVTILTDMMPVRMRELTAAAMSALGVVLFFVISRGSVDGFMNAWTFGSYEGEGALRVPVWPVRLAVLVGSVLATLAYLLLTLRHLQGAVRGRLSPEALVDG